jgi:hypothetical protein
METQLKILITPEQVTKLEQARVRMEVAHLLMALMVDRTVPRRPWVQSCEYDKYCHKFRIIY